MGIDGFRMLQWSLSSDGPWWEAAESRYREGGFDGLGLYGFTGILPDLAFVHRLEGLRALRVQGRVKDDRAAFLVPGLEELSLVTGSRVRLPAAAQPALRNLVMAHRPGIEVASRWPGLQSLRLGMWRGADLQLLSGAEKLVSFYAEGRRQAGNLEGIERCRSVEYLTMVNYSVSGTAPLRGLSMLSELRMHARSSASPHNIDLADVSESRLRLLWISNASMLRHVEALLEMRFLRNVRLTDCHLEDADRLVLGSLPARVRVDIF